MQHCHARLGQGGLLRGDVSIDAEYECGRDGYDCKSSSTTNIFKLTKAYKGFVVELVCEKGKSGYATRYNYTMDDDTHNYERRKSFHFDNDLETACQQTSTKSYKHPECTPQGNRRKNQFCYDRGHIVMADHMDSDPVTMYESNTMTNILPQAAGFNQAGGAWKFTEDLIECTRHMASIDKQVIFGGMIYDNSSNDYFLESHGIPTPDLYWKVVIRYFKSARSWTLSASSAPTPEVIAWIFPNAFDAGREKLNIRFNRNDERGVGGYLISIAELQLITGDGMQELPEEFRERAYEVGRTWAKPSCGKETAKLPTPVPDL